MPEKATKFKIDNKYFEVRTLFKSNSFCVHV